MKRVFDIVVSAVALTLLLPVFAAIALAARWEDGGPALFCQQRIGRAGKPFAILKFRTMRRVAGPPITSAADGRITRVGRRLRRWKLDELPQLWNVLRGDMSLVGPRPELPQYVVLYPEETREVLRVRPGITGLSQLDGIREEEELRDAPDPERLYREVLLPRKLETDLAYARSAGLRMDLWILWQTARRLLSGPQGASRAA